MQKQIMARALGGFLADQTTLGGMDKPFCLSVFGRMRKRFICTTLGLFLSALTISAYGHGTHAAVVDGWLNWRGPDQAGYSHETGLIDRVEVDGAGQLWTYDLAGRGTAVVAASVQADDKRERLYVLGYKGDGPDLQEVLVCLDARTGKHIWEHGFNDFLSDIVYNRYAIGAPTVDAETGNVYMQTTAGEMAAFSADGNLLWSFSMMDRFGRLTFPNGRTGSPVIDQDLVIVHGITSYWGADGPARDRFFAFDKLTGEPVWSSTPGIGPHDSSFSTPLLEWRNGQHVLYAGTGCGNVVCVNTRTGAPLWRYHMSHGGVNSSVVLDGDTLVAIHGKENLDSSTVGRMIGLNLDFPYGQEEQVLKQSSETWRHDICMFTSSPTLAKGRVYQVDHTGVLHCLDVKSGDQLWAKKLSNAQLHASPLYADGKLYVPVVNGLFYILRPGDTDAEELCKITLAGQAIGSPSVWNGRIFVHTTEKLYCFGKDGDNPGRPGEEGPRVMPLAGEASRLQIVPADVLLYPQQQQTFRVRSVDGNGQAVGNIKPGTLKWETFIPPTAKVKSTANGSFNDQGRLIAGDAKASSAGAFKATAGPLTGLIRTRVLPNLPFEEDFESYELTVPHAEEEGVKFAYPPLAWIGARFKWEVRELDGNKVFAKTLNVPLFQRALTFIGAPDMQGYTMEADLYSDGNRRGMSDLGLVNQRYIIALKGNQQLLEVSSNHDRLKVGVPFAWDHKKWYRLKCRVDINPDGSGVVRAKAWEKGGDEPTGWLIEVPHLHAHRQGSPGFFGFSPQSQFRVYIDNVKVYYNK